MFSNVNGFWFFKVAFSLESHFSSVDLKTLNSLVFTFGFIDFDYFLRISFWLSYCGVEVSFQNLSG
jgi:hypothetical protein